MECERIIAELNEPDRFRQASRAFYLEGIATLLDGLTSEEVYALFADRLDAEDPMCYSDNEMPILQRMIVDAKALSH